MKPLFQVPIVHILINKHPNQQNIKTLKSSGHSLVIIQFKQDISTYEHPPRNNQAISLNSCAELDLLLPLQPWTPSQLVPCTKYPTYIIGITLHCIHYTKFTPQTLLWIYYKHKHKQEYEANTILNSYIIHTPMQVFSYYKYKLQASIQCSYLLKLAYQTLVNILQTQTQIRKQNLHNPKLISYTNAASIQLL